MITDAQKWLVSIGALLFSWLVYRLAPILTPFLIGIILAYSGNPVVNRLETTVLSRTLAVVPIFIIMMIVSASMLIIILPLLQEQITGLMMRIPDMINVIQSKYLGGIASFLGVDMEMDAVPGEFFRGQLLVMLAQSIIYSTGLWIVGLEIVSACILLR